MGTDKLFDELKLALALTSKADLAAWGRTSASRLPIIGKRRLTRLGELVSRIGEVARSELRGAMTSWRNGNFGVHLENRVATGIDNSIDIGKSAWRVIGTVGQSLLDDPKKNAPGVLALALGFLVGSGGPDGNGGIPDTDISMFGIGEHRSIFTHSIIAGIVAEGSILALADLAGIVCEKLPKGHRDPFWDKLDAMKDQIALQLASGTSAGIAYHLGVDATLQPAAYKDLPLSMPLEAHQLLFATNAAAEGAHAARATESEQIFYQTYEAACVEARQFSKKTGASVKIVRASDNSWVLEGTSKIGKTGNASVLSNDETEQCVPSLGQRIKQIGKLAADGYKSVREGNDARIEARMEAARKYVRGRMK